MSSGHPRAVALTRRLAKRLELLLRPLEALITFSRLAGDVEQPPLHNGDDHTLGWIIVLWLYLLQLSNRLIIAFQRLQRHGVEKACADLRLPL